jgi:oxalate decarboxylase/phosphoglucose isomerase-like protein (cupin superfamily)
MSEAGYKVTHIEKILEPAGEKEAGDPDWHAVRIHFGIQSFGINAYTAVQEGQLVWEHDEIEHSGTKHEELYYVSKGSATFTVDGETVEAPTGTFVYVPDPASIRSAVAHEPGTTILCLGGTPGEAFSVSPWEQKYDPASAS